jgi:hypothetical protein
VTKLAILTLATLLSSCTGGSSPAPTGGGLTGETAAQLTTRVQQATQGLHDCVVPIGVSYEASGDLQCVLDGKPVRFLTFAPPTAAPTAVPKLWDRTVLFGSTWIVIATDLAQAQSIQRVIGGRLYLTPVLVAPSSVTVVGPRPRSCPIGCAVRFRVSVRNPLNSQAVFSCHARGLSADGKVLFREPGIAAESVQPPTDAGAVAELSGVAHTERPGTVARVIAWCTARPLTQPQ